MAAPTRTRLGGLPTAGRHGRTPAPPACCGDAAPPPAPAVRASPRAALLLVAELAIRAVRAPLHFGSFRELRTDMMRRNYPAELHPVLGYSPRPNFASTDNHWGTRVSIDADGMRKNGDGPPPPGDAAIVAVGDSFTFGDEVDDDATWPARLERILQQRVVNGGVFGYSLAQAVLRAEDSLQRRRVEAVVVSFIPDDLVRCEFRRRYTPVPWFDFEGDGLVLRGVPIDHAEASADAGKAWKDLLGHSALVDAVLANTVRTWWFENEKQVAVPSLVGRGPEIGKRLLTRLAAKCRDAGARLLVVLQGPDPEPSAVEVLRFASAHGIATLDLATQFQERSAADASLQRRWFRGHMTPEGNAWVAVEVAAALRGGR